MRFQEDKTPDNDALCALFATTFAASDGAEEGALVGALAEALLGTSPKGGLRIFTAMEGDTLAGAIFLTPLRYAQDDRAVSLVAPVAVRTDLQRQGIGQGLLRHLIAALRDDGADVLVTYGDPAYYTRVGFQQVPVTMVAAPYPLSQPIGWMALPLGNTPLTPLTGTVTCVPAFDNPAYW